LARTRRADWRRHLDGWQGGAIVLVLAGSAILLGVPRSVPPEEIPPPHYDVPTLQAVIAEDDHLAEEAARTELDVDVRTLGREMRAYNTVAATGKGEELVPARAKLAEAATKAQLRSMAGVRQLRAWQMKQFLAELSRWQATGEETEELHALGGDFLAAARRNGWCTGPERKMVPDGRVLRVLYKKRWNDVAGLRSEELGLSLAEDQIRFGFLLEHPFRGVARVVGAAVDERVAAFEQAKAQLEIIERLAARDPDYPAELARGVVEFRLGRFPIAAEAFRRHLEVSPDGAWALRARNYLKAALDRANEP
jgi:tetratricopeptide (TPR) repeat protein